MLEITLAVSDEFVLVEIFKKEAIDLGGSIFLAATGFFSTNFPQDLWQKNNEKSADSMI